LFFIALVYSKNHAIKNQFLALNPQSAANELKSTPVLTNWHCYNMAILATVYCTNGEKCKHFFISSVR